MVVPKVFQFLKKVLCVIRQYSDVLYPIINNADMFVVNTHIINGLSVWRFLIISQNIKQVIKYINKMLDDKTEFSVVEAPLTWHKCFVKYCQFLCRIVIYQINS